MKDRRIHRVDIVPHRQVRQRQTLVEQPLVQEPCLAAWCACPRFGDVACYLLPSQGQKGRLEDREVARLLLEREIEMAVGGIRRSSTNADRSEERHVGKASVRTIRTRWYTQQYKKTPEITTK